MPKTISIATALESHRVASEVPFICLIQLGILNRNTGLVVETLRIARNPDPVTFKGFTWEPALFDISVQQEAGKFAEVKLSINDYTQAIQARMEEYSGGIGSKVTFYVVNADNLASNEPDVAEFFEITSASSSEYRQEFTLGAENSLMQTFPRRRQTKDFCQWRYKSSFCGYAGALPTCDLSLQGPNGCAVHGNTARFGAFPGLNSNGFRYV